MLRLLLGRGWVTPFIVALGGVLSDYATTTYALNFCTGLYETHPQYSPIWALIIFWGAIALLTLTLPRRGPWRISIDALALVSYTGAINNILVILGLFSGINI